jgi:hypothetical protein
MGKSLIFGLPESCVVGCVTVGSRVRGREECYRRAPRSFVYAFFIRHLSYRTCTSTILPNAVSASKTCRLDPSSSPTAQEHFHRVLLGLKETS